MVIAANTSWYLANFRAATFRLLIEQGWEVHAVAPDDKYRDTLESFGASFHEVNLERRGLGLLSAMNSMLSFFRLYRDLNPDVTHHFTIKVVILGGIAARLNHVSGIVSAISGLGIAFDGASRIRGWMGSLGLRLGIRRGEPVVFQNPEDRSFLVKRGLVDEQDGVLIRGSGVDPEEFAPDPDQEPGEGLTLFTACRMLWPKGIRELLQAVQICRERGHDIRVRLLGEPDPGNPDAIPREWLASQDELEHVHWIGFQDDVRPALRRADVVVAPTYYPEGLPRMLLEGAAMGKALIATDIPGCREIVIPGETGILVRVRDPEDLAAAIIRLSADSTLCARYGKAARQRVIAEFSEDHVAEATLLCYERALGIRSRCTSAT